MSIKLTSPSFEDGEMIPSRHTCEGDDISPPLKWEGLPEGTKSIALIMDDPDAPRGTWVHWVFYNISPDKKALNENLPPNEVLDDGSLQGKNSWGSIGYGGPCPPRGVHRYYFKLYALDSLTLAEPGATKEDLLESMGTHIIGQGQLMGRYERA